MLRMFFNLRSLLEKTGRDIFKEIFKKGKAKENLYASE